MKPLTDAALGRLRESLDHPDAGDRYEVHDLLGRGGMGAVYRATDRVLQREVALKVLAIELDQSEAVRRLEREARVLAQLEHPGIVAVHDAGRLADGRPFYVMRLVRGRRLDELAPAEGRGQLLRRFLAVCDAVSFAHSRGVIHRDLKPGNVMIGEFGEVLVLDWGVAKLAGGPADAASARIAPTEEHTGDGIAVGTPGFMAPEQASGRLADVDARADVYGLGQLLRGLLGRERSPAPLRAIVARATALEPGGRYPSVDALAADVRAWLDGLAVSAYAERPWERAARFYRRNEALVLLLLAYLAVRLFILWWRGV
ncbi:MAG: serine/threonine protein kinase [Gemmatimonadaceae bacterium]|nr:serine/threonine protein kinase [Gemmatimonadaceae bacterium]